MKSIFAHRPFVPGTGMHRRTHRDVHFNVPSGYVPSTLQPGLRAFILFPALSSHRRPSPVVKISHPAPSGFLFFFFLFSFEKLLNRHLDGNRTAFREENKNSGDESTTLQFIRGKKIGKSGGVSRRSCSRLTSCGRRAGLGFLTKMRR